MLSQKFQNGSHQSDSRSTGTLNHFTALYDYLLDLKSQGHGQERGGFQIESRSKMLRAHAVLPDAIACKCRPGCCIHIRKAKEPKKQMIQ